MLNVFFKNRFSDKYLKNLRKQLASYIPVSSRVIDIGCGTGALLFDLSDKIIYGLGIDKDSSMIKFAQRKSEREGCENLEFKIIDADTFSSKKDYDIAILSLIIHSLNKESRLNILKKSSFIADKVIVADYVLIGGFKSFFIHIDEILAGHYRNFRKYGKNEIENLIKEASLVIRESIKTKYPEIGIWACSSQYLKPLP